MAKTVKLFDAHCHLQDPRVLNKAPQLIAAALDTGVARFAVNGVSEKDWSLVKDMGEQYPSVVPCFGLHPWFIRERTPNWFDTLQEFFEATPTAAVGEISLDKGSHGKTIDFADQVEVLKKQFQLAKELNKPASVHCVRAFGDLLEKHGAFSCWCHPSFLLGLSRDGSGTCKAWCLLLSFWFPHVHEKTRQRRC